MNEPREVRVKITADVDEYISNIQRAAEATSTLSNSEDVQQVRTGASHRYPRAVAVDPINEFQFRVDPIPHVDHAARALRRAQQRYAERYNVSTEDMADLIWTIRKIQ